MYVRVGFYLCIWAFMFYYVCMYLRVRFCFYLCRYLNVFMYIFARMYVYLCLLHVSVNVRVCMYVYACMFMYVCVRVRVWQRARIQKEMELNLRFSIAYFQTKLFITVFWFLFFVFLLLDLFVRLCGFVILKEFDFF